MIKKLVKYLPKWSVSGKIPERTMRTRSMVTKPVGTRYMGREPLG